MLIVNARFLTQELTGVQRFAIEISKQLKAIYGNNIQFITPHNILHIDLANTLNAKKVGTKSGHLWEQIDLPSYLKEQGSPLLLNLANTAPLFYVNKIVTVHDVAFLRFPKNFDWKFRLFYQLLIPKIIKNSKHVFTVSQFSKSEIVEFYGTKQDKISVIYNATSDIFKEIEHCFYDKYILAVSSLNHQKNFHSLIKAFNGLEDKTIKLYLAGRINKNFADIELLHDIESNENIIFQGHVDDETLVKLYSNATCFVYPSLYEGFGIPPLEAQSCGTPVICSNVASLPEVGGEDSVLYVDPYDVDDIKDKIEELISNQTLQDELRVKGFENIKRFSWGKSADKIKEMIGGLE
jgi:glycosyltransferase involved in cell wall biosynthesis